MLLLAPFYRFFCLPKEVRRKDYPNLDQSRMSDDPNWKRVLCAPVADTDALAHLNSTKHFMQESKGEDASRTLAQELARDMGTRPATDPNPGTEPDELVKGTEKFLNDHSKKLSFSEWRGWGANQTKRNGATKIPTYNWIAKQMKNNREVVLHVGMYKKNSDGSYQRVAGHYVTCTGFKKSDLSFNIDDPAPRASRQEKSTKTKTLKSGIMQAGEAKQKARGYIQLENLDLAEGADLAIVDGAFAFSC